MAADTEQATHKLCPICHEDIDYFAYGACNHPTCTKCILKLRKFGSADEPDFSKCPTCRRNLNLIVIMESFVPFDDVQTGAMRHDAQYDFMFPTQEIERYYRDMLRSYCPICGEEKNSLSALNRHTTLEHQLSYCDLCIRYARLLPCEFVPMKPADLVEHRKWDKQRRRGHPLCDFCQERFYEFEDLIHHIRDSHFLCDLCMTSGKVVVFREQHELLTHYGDSHHLCAECRAEQRISCFATAERLGLHRFQEHPNAVNNDPDPWMPITVELARNTEHAAGNRRRDPAYPVVDRVGGVLSASDGRLIAEGTAAGVRFRRPNPAEWTGDDFPALAAATNERSPTQPTSAQSRDAPNSPAADNTTSRQTPSRGPVRTGQPGATLAELTGRGRHARLTADDFPTLSGSDTKSSGSTPMWIKSSGWSGGRTQPPGKASTEPGVARPPRSQPQPLPTDSDFPGLPHDSNRTGLPSGGNPGWATVHTRAPNSDGANRDAPSTAVAPTIKRSPPTASDFPGLMSGGDGAGAKPLAPVLPPYTERPSGKRETNRGGGGAGGANRRQQRRQMARADPDPLPADSGSTVATTTTTKMLRPRQHNNADIRYAMTETEEDDSKARRNLSHIQTVDAFPTPSPPVDCSSTPSAPPAAPHPDEFPSLGAVETNHNGGRPAPPKGKSASKANHTARVTTPAESVVPKAKNTSQKKPTTSSKVAGAASNSTNISAHDLIDTECVLFANTPYTLVPDAVARNRDLIRTVELALFDLGGKTAFTRFADFSRRYRHKELTATAYLEGLVGLLTPRAPGAAKQAGDDSDANTTPLWIATMLALLPDVGLQRALLRALQGQGAPKLPPELLPPNTGRIREPIIPPPAWAKAVLGLVQCCRQCGQVCLRVDLQQHVQQAHESS